MTSQKSGAGGSEAWAGVRDTLTTVVPSILAYGVVWGGLARQAGLSQGELIAMCLLVTAGTAQFVALPMIQSGAPAWLIATRRFGKNEYRSRVERIDIATVAGQTRREKAQAFLNAEVRVFERAVADAPDQWWTLFFQIWDDIQ